MRMEKLKERERERKYILGQTQRTQNVDVE